MTNPFNRIGIKRNPNSVSPPEPETQFGADVRLIGDRDAGKTTFLAALTYYPNRLAHSPIASVAPQADAETLVQDAKRLLEQGLSFEPTSLKSVTTLEQYDVRITFKSEFSKQEIAPTISSPLILDVTFRDYSGEFLDLLQSAGTPVLQEQLKNYIDNCVTSNGILFLVDGLESGKDDQYAERVEKLLQLMVKRRPDAPNPWKVAVVVTKCEMYELFVHRREPNFLARARFPRLCERLQSWSNNRTIKVNYFTVSAFGRLGNDAYGESNSRKIDPNSDRVGLSCLREPDRWRPFGIVAPIYWLCTGKRSLLLEQD